MKKGRNTPKGDSICIHGKAIVARLWKFKDEQEKKVGIELKWPQIVEILLNRKGDS